MKNYDFYLIADENDFINKTIFIKDYIHKFTNAINNDYNFYYSYLLLKNFLVKSYAKNVELEISAKSEFLPEYFDIKDYCEKSHFHKIFKKIAINVYNLNLNDFKMFKTYDINWYDKKYHAEDLVC